MKLNFLRQAALAILLVVLTVAAHAGIVKGIVVDAATKEPLIGAIVVVENTTKGAVVGVDGDFTLELTNGECNLVVSYVSYQTQTIAVTVTDNTPELNIEMESDGLAVEEVQVVGRKNLENVMALQTERKISTVAIENIGAKEMSIKGISNAEEGVKKMTGISVASAGQVVVRGLGDRYSSTTLNGQPIASPNPDNKLIPLDVFPSSAIKNITVSKVYTADTYADYSGAHIDIATKDQRSSKFFELGVSAGANFNTLGNDFYRMDNTTLFKQSSVDPLALSSSLADYREYVVTKDIFDTDFSVSSKKSIPVFGGNLGYGNSFNVGNQKLSILATGGISNDQVATYDNEYKVIEATGGTTDSYVYDSYETSLKLAALANIGLTLRDNDNISYTMFYARNAEEEYQNREGDTDNQGHVYSSNSVTHIYKLLTNQIHGSHVFGNSWGLNWNGTYSTTASDEPDRRQVMFRNTADSDTDLMLLTDDQQATMRYFGSLEENEWNGDVSLDYNFGEAHKLTFGGAYKDKAREYSASRFYYDVFSVRNDVVGDNMYDTAGYLNFQNVADGTIEIDRKKQPQDSYDATMDIVSGFASLDLSFNEDILLNLGLRYEQSNQTVNYYDTDYATRTLKSSDFFPALNLKYSFMSDQQLRFAFSRTITRPSFIEMAPFLYQESYGSAQVVGNADLQNGYNYNLDLRYETFYEGGDMFSATLYYKQLQDPIERVQEKKSGATQHTFMNAENGVAAGVELEVRKAIIKDLVLSVNGSFMYTDVKLSDGGVYTNKERQLQGASPYLFNADIAYSPIFANEKQFTLALLYNLQGPRIHSVGIQGNGDIIQEAYNKLNFVTSYQLSKKATIKLECSNLLNEEESYVQEIPTTGEKVTVERHSLGMGASVGVSFKF
ncbi:MAG: TonB-dependent receptor [Rikenellaceae bacterium]